MRISAVPDNIDRRYDEMFEDEYDYSTSAIDYYTGDLVDIRTVSVDKNLSKLQRIIEFIRQIRNPYRFKCGKFTVSVRFSKNGPTLEQCLRGLAA